jgi:hypothetical protein
MLNILLQSVELQYTRIMSMFALVCDLHFSVTYKLISAISQMNAGVYMS